MKNSLNKIYRLVWSTIKNAWVPVAESAKARGKSGGRTASVTSVQKSTRLGVKAMTRAVVTALMAMSATTAFAAAPSSNATDETSLIQAIQSVFSTIFVNNDITATTALPAVSKVVTFTASPTPVSINSSLTNGSPLITLSSGTNLVTFGAGISFNGGAGFNLNGLNVSGSAGAAGDAVNGSSFTLTNNGTIAGGTGGAYTAHGSGGAGAAGDAVNGDSFTLTNNGTITGGTGGAYSALGSGGGAGAGGDAINGTGFTLTNYGTITGGVGGAYNSFGGSAGAGGDAINGTGFTLTNYGTITGGVGGAYNSFGGSAGAGGDAIKGTGFTLTNYGTITGSSGGQYTGSGNGVAGAGGGAVNGSGFTLTNHGTITGGVGGAYNGLGGGSAGAGAGGYAVKGTSFTLTNNSNGTITGGNSGAYTGQGGVAGAGGDAINGSDFTLTNYGTITGGIGGSINSGISATAGAGGHAINGSGFILTNNINGNITGGTGGAFTGLGGIAGAGGGAVNGDGFTLTNYGTITGGTGGTYTSLGGGAGGHAGAGGKGIISTGNSTIDNFSTISGGLNGDGTVRNDAINFSGGGNKLIIESGSTITGNVVSTSGTTNGGDVLSLGGNVNATFNLNQIGPAAQYQGFNNIAKEGTSTWTLTGTNTGLTPWTINAGTLALDNNASLNGAVNISHGGTLSSANASVIGQVNNRQTLEVSAGSTLTITGSYFQDVLAVFQTNVASNTSYGKLLVNGNADIIDSNNINVNVVDAPTLSAGTVLSSVIRATGTLSVGQTLAITDNSALFNFTGATSADGKAVDLTIVAAAATGGPSVLTSTQGSNGTGAGRTLDDIIKNGGSPGMQTVTTALGQLGTSQQVSDAVQQTLPLMSASMTEANMASLYSINRIVQARQSSNKGLSSGDDFLGDRHIWFKPFGSWASQDNHNGAAGYDARSFGGILGFDGELSDQNNIGLAFAYTRTNVDSNSSVAAQSADINSYQAIVYGSHGFDARTELSYQADVGYHDNEGNRTINFGGLNSIANSNYNSWSGHIGAGLSRSYAMGPSTTITPVIRADYSRIHDQAYSETGAGALNLNVNSNSTDELVLLAEGRLSHAVTERATLLANLGIGYDVLSDNNAITATYTGGGTAFSTQGIDPSATLVRGGLGFVISNSKALELTARYDFEARSHFDNQTASLKIRVPF